MNRRAVLILVAVVGFVAVLVWLLYPQRGPGPIVNTIVEVHEVPTPTPAPAQRVVMLYLGGDGLLHPELRIVPLPIELSQRVGVVVAELLRGPDPEGRLAPAMPFPAELLGVYVIGSTAFVDLTAPEAPLAGSHTELAMTYSVVNSVLLNCPELSAVQLLFSGQEVSTLTGHLDLSRPLALNKRFIAS